MGSKTSMREERRWAVGLVNENSASSPVPRRHLRQRRFPPRLFPTASISAPAERNTKKVEPRINELADLNGKQLGLSRRQFLHTSCGMAAAFLAMNEIYGNVFQVALPRPASPS